MIAWQKALKRLFDIVCSLAALILLSPFLLAVALAVSLESGGGAFFTQPRVGRDGRLFRIFKFRSMLPHPIDYQRLQEVDSRNPYLTLLGRRLRQYGIDELPQLLNILRGEMSFVGPRPTIQEQVDKYSPFQRRRLEVLPGLTGLAQVSGNTSLPWEERILLDVWYIDHWSLWLDTRIFFYSFLIVFLGRVMEQRLERPSYLPSLHDAQRYALHIEQRLGAG